MMCGEREERQLDLADLTCTALQLANHWQDVRRDILDRNRIYIPMEVAGQHGLDLESMAEFVRLNESRMPALELAAVPARFGLVLGELVRRTEPLFARGRALWDMVGADVRPVLRLFTFGGEAILRRTARSGGDTLRRRPRLGRLNKLWILGRVWLTARWGWR